MCTKQCYLVNNLVYTTNTNYHSNLIVQHKDDSNALFSGITKLLHCKPVKHFPTCASDLEVSSQFNDFFHTKIAIIPKGSDRLPQTMSEFPFLHVSPYCQCKLSNFSTINEDELHPLIKNPFANLGLN